MGKIIRHYKPGGENEDLEKSLSIDQLRKLLNGYVEYHSFGKLIVMCDEDGKMKNLPACRNIAGATFVGDIYVGRMGKSGLVPVEAEEIAKFEERYMR